MCRPIFTEDVNLAFWETEQSVPKTLEIPVNKEQRESEGEGIVCWAEFIKSLQLMSYVSSEMAKILLRGDYLAKKSASKSRKLLQWHLFKGGLAGA